MHKLRDALESSQHGSGAICGPDYIHSIVYENFQVEAERWIVDLIRNYRIDGAKINSQLGQVVMGTKATSIHEQVMESTKRLTFRSQQVALQLQKLKSDRKVCISCA